MVIYDRLFVIAFVSFLFKCFAKDTVKPANAQPIYVGQLISATVGATVEFSCNKSSSSSSSSSSSESVYWTRMTEEDAKRCTKKLLQIKDNHWFCEVLVSNRIVQTAFRERVSTFPFRDPRENDLILRNASLEDSGRYFCFINSSKEIKQIYNLSIHLTTTVAASLSLYTSNSTTSSSDSTSVPSQENSTEGIYEQNVSIIATATCAVFVVCSILIVIIFILRQRNSNKDDGQPNELNEVQEALSSSSVENRTYICNDEETQNKELLLYAEINGPAERNVHYESSRVPTEEVPDVNAGISIYHLLPAEDVYDPCAAHGTLEPYSNVVDVDGLVYLELKAGDGIPTDHTVCHPIANLFNKSIYSSIDHTLKAVPPPPTLITK